MGNAPGERPGLVLAGLVFFGALARGGLGPEARTLLPVGFLGSFTTMSTFSLETVALLEEARGWTAAANIAGNLGLSLAAAFAGRGLALALPGGGA